MDPLIDLGGMKRRLPVGGCAKGIPRYLAMPVSEQTEPVSLSPLGRVICGAPDVAQANVALPRRARVLHGDSMMIS
jgi:hypothetical protein